jgi:competence protein ComEA
MSEGSIRDRLSTLSRRELAGLVAIVVITLVGGAVWYVRSLPKPVQVTSSLGQPGAPAVTGVGASPVAGPTASPASLFVDVAGMVRRPGVYEFREGDRVIDAIRAAGGERGGAALDGLNLAAPLADGTQILVPKRAPAGVSPVGQTGGTSAGISGAPAAKINVNTADATQLQELPGIGEVLSQAIVDYRTKNGPFGSVDELEDVSGIGPATMDDIRQLVTI